MTTGTAPHRPAGTARAAAHTLSTAEAVRLVARREFVERGRDRSFVVSTAFTLFIMLAIIVVPALLDLGDDEPRRVAVSADDGGVRPAIERYAAELDIDVDVVDATGDPRRAVTQQDVDAVVTDGAIVVDERLPDELAIVLQQAVKQVATDRRLAAAGIDAAAVRQAADVPPLRVEAVDPPDPDAETRENVARIGTIVLYGQLLGYGFWVALGVVEEKSSRVVELLLSTISARALLAGKILGIGALGLGQLLLVVGVALGAAAALDVVSLGSATLVPIALVLAWFVLGYFFYATVFAAAAARVSRQEDVQNVTTPATTVVLISFFASFWVGSNPDAPLARALAVLPPFSALVNPVRVSVGEAPWWEVVLAVVLMLAATAALTLVGARLYEGGVLRTGGKVSVREAWRSRLG